MLDPFTISWSCLFASSFFLIAKIPKFSILLFIGVYGPKFTKCSTIKHSSICLPWSLKGLQQKISWDSQQTWHFHTCTSKCAYRLYIQRSKVKVERRLLPVPQPFQACRNSLRHRSRLLSFCLHKFSWGLALFGTGVHKVHQIPVSVPNFSKIRCRTAEIRLANMNK